MHPFVVTVLVPFTTAALLFLAGWAIRALLRRWWQQL